jgi:hypothetical protein
MYMFACVEFPKVELNEMAVVHTDRGGWVPMGVQASHVMVLIRRGRAFRQLNHTCEPTTHRLTCVVESSQLGMEWPRLFS